MANKIQVKRGLLASLPTLDVGEPALTTNYGAEKVYIGTGTGNKQIPTLVGGTLPIGNGGTGTITLALARNAMGLGNTTGALPVANGGTGTTTLALLRNSMGLGNTTGVLPVANGGTGASTLNSGTVGLGSVLNYGIATQAEAQAGTSNVKYMTPLRVKEAMSAIEYPVYRNYFIPSIFINVGDITPTSTVGSVSTVFMGTIGRVNYGYNRSNYGVLLATIIKSITRHLRTGGTANQLSVRYKVIVKNDVGSTIGTYYSSSVIPTGINVEYTLTFSSAGSLIIPCTIDVYIEVTRLAGTTSYLYDASGASATIDANWVF